jgi:hypothetical protein
MIGAATPWRMPIARDRSMAGLLAPGSHMSMRAGRPVWNTTAPRSSPGDQRPRTPPAASHAPPASQPAAARTAPRPTGRDRPGSRCSRSPWRPAPCTRRADLRGGCRLPLQPLRSDQGLAPQ